MKRILGSCTILLLAVAATQTIASAQETSASGQETPGLEGVWLAKITVNNCSGVFLRNVQNLEMYIRDGTVSDVGGTVPPSPQPLPRTSSIGTWRHVQAHTYTATHRFFGLNPDGTLANMVTAVRTMKLKGDGFIGSDVVTVQDLDGQVLSTACTSVSGIRLPAQ